MPNNPEAELFEEFDWFLVLVEVTDVDEVAEVLRLATAANVSKRLTALASEAVKFGSETLMLVGEFLFSVVSMGTWSEVATGGGGGGGGNAGGGVKSSDVEKSKSRDKPLGLRDDSEAEELEGKVKNILIFFFGH